MFIKKRKKNNEVESDKNNKVHIETIPDVFYGGSDPVIYKNKVAPEKKEHKKNDQSIKKKYKKYKSISKSN